jgi:hypothetical protein
LFKVNAAYDDDRLQNLIIVAAKSSAPNTSPTPDNQIAGLLAHQYLKELPPGGAILTDDLAPVEYYNSIAQNIYLSSR